MLTSQDSNAISPPITGPTTEGENLWENLREDARKALPASIEIPQAYGKPLSEAELAMHGEVSPGARGPSLRKLFSDTPPVRVVADSLGKPPEAAASPKALTMSALIAMAKFPDGVVKANSQKPRKKTFEDLPPSIRRVLTGIDGGVQSWRRFVELPRDPANSPLRR